MGTSWLYIRMLGFSSTTLTSVRFLSHSQCHVIYLISAHRQFPERWRSSHTRSINHCEQPHAAHKFSLLSLSLCHSHSWTLWRSILIDTQFRLWIQVLDWCLCKLVLIIKTNSSSELLHCEEQSRSLCWSSNVQNKWEMMVLLVEKSHLELLNKTFLFNIKGVISWRVKFSLIFWDQRALCTICSLCTELPLQYKRNIYWKQTVTYSVANNCLPEI